MRDEAPTTVGVCRIIHSRALITPGYLLGIATSKYTRPSAKLVQYHWYALAYRMPCLNCIYYNSTYP